MDIVFALKHFFLSGHYNGHRVHSPNIFNFFLGTLFSKESFDYSLAEDCRKKFLNNNSSINVLSIGAKGDGKSTEKKRISDIAKKSSSYGKYGRLLQRISSYLKPKKILELGTSLGIGTLYLYAGEKTAKVITLEASTETAEFAKNNFKSLNLENNIECINKAFDSVFETILQQNPDIELFYVDGNHTFEATIRYYNLICKYALKTSVVIFDDINWSREMSKAWSEIKKTKECIVSIETFRMGIVFFDNNLTQKNYIVRY